MTKAAELAALIGSQTARGSKNLIDNGAMNIFQRATSATGVTSEAYHTSDRFKTNMNDAGTFTVSQSDTVPAGQGFSNSLKLDCTTADAAVAAGSYMSIDHRIEAHNLQRLNWGTSSAKKLTISFWVRSNLTGTFVVEFLHGDTTVYNSNTYTIDAADTWEKKTVTISGYTPTAINDDNGIGLYIFWWLQSGSTYGSGTTTNDSWHSTQANRAGSLTVDLGTSTDNEFYLTGVQLEIGEQATPFEHRSIADDLATCQRYFVQLLKSDSTKELVINGAQSGATNFNCFLPYSMRAAPTITWPTSSGVRGEGTTVNISSIASNLNGTFNYVHFNCTIASGLTANTASFAYAYQGVTTLSAEL